MRTHKERSAQLSTENETLQEQLQERLQELEKVKVGYSPTCSGFTTALKSVYSSKISSVLRRWFGTGRFERRETAGAFL